MIKKLLIFVTLCCILAIAAIYLFGSSLISKAIVTGVETFGPPITQTTVELDAVELSLLQGNVTLRGLRVGNPEGYKQPNIFALGEVVVDVDTGSLTSDTIIVNKIHILQTEISYETGLNGSNVKQLQKNVEAFTAKPDQAPTEEPETEVAQDDSGPSKQVIIRELVIDDTQVYTGLMGAGIKVKLPRIEKHNIGEKGEKVTIAESINLILSEVLSAIGPAISNSAGAIGDAGKSLGKSVGDAGKSVGEAGKSATDSAVKGIKNLFGQ